VNVSRHASTSFGWQSSLLPLSVEDTVKQYVLTALPWSGLSRIPIILMRGPTRSSGREGTLLVAGQEPWVRYLPDRFFVTEPKRESLDVVSIWTLRGALRRWRSSVDMTIARVDRISAGLLFGSDYLVVPEWVGIRIPVPQNVDEFVRGVRSIHEDMRVIRRNRLRPLITRTKMDFDVFYEAVYVPYVCGRHKESALVASRPLLYGVFRRGGILWVIHGERRIAAGLFERRGETIQFWAIGAVNGDETMMKQRAFTAVYYFLLQYAREEGCTQIDLRGVRPSLHDGLFRYKRKWGGMIYDKREGSYHDLLLHWERPNGIVNQFLSHTSLIFRDQGGLSALHTDESQSRRSLWIDGLQQIYLLKASGRQPMGES
jgi:hypothetical protein